MIAVARSIDPTVSTRQDAPDDADTPGPAGPPPGGLWSLRRVAAQLGLPWQTIAAHAYRCSQGHRDQFPPGAETGDILATSPGCRMILQRCPPGVAVNQMLDQIAREPACRPAGASGDGNTSNATGPLADRTASRPDALPGTIEKLVRRVEELTGRVAELEEMARVTATGAPRGPLGVAPHPIVNLFAERFLVADPDGVVAGEILLLLAEDFWKRRAGDRSWHAPTFGRYLRAAVPTLRVVVDYAGVGEPRRKPRRDYCGVRLSKWGMKYLGRGEE